MIAQPAAPERRARALMLLLKYFVERRVSFCQSSAIDLFSGDVAADLAVEGFCADNVCGFICHALFLHFFGHPTHRFFFLRVVFG